MGRGLSSQMQTYFAAETVMPLWFVHLALAQPSYTWTGVGLITTLGSQWVGVGDHGIISGIQSSRELRSHEISLALVGIPTSEVPASALQATRRQQYQGKAVNIYVAAGNPDTGLPYIDPELVWSGFADVLTFQYGRTISVAVTAEHMASHLSRPNGLRMSTESHNARLGNPATRDLFFDCQSRLAGVPRPLLQG